MLYSSPAAGAIGASLRISVACAGTTSSSSVLPTWILSPCRSASRPEISAVLTNVPFAEPRSSTNARSPST